MSWSTRDEVSVRITVIDTPLNTKGISELRVFGALDGDEHKRSACVHISGLRAYLLVRADHSNAPDVTVFQDELERALKNQYEQLAQQNTAATMTTSGRTKNDVIQPQFNESTIHSVIQTKSPLRSISITKPHHRCPIIDTVEAVQRIPVYGYAANAVCMYKVNFFRASSQTRAADLLRSTAISGGPYQVFQAHVPFHLQALIELGVYGMNLLRFPRACANQRSSMHTKVSNCFLELDVSSDDVIRACVPEHVSVPSLAAIIADLRVTPDGIASQLHRPHAEICGGGSGADACRAYRNALSEYLDSIVAAQSEGSFVSQQQVSTTQEMLLALNEKDIDYSIQCDDEDKDDDDNDDEDIAYSPIDITRNLEGCRRQKHFERIEQLTQSTVNVQPDSDDDDDNNNDDDDDENDDDKQYSLHVEINQNNVDDEDETVSKPNKAIRGILDERKDGLFEVIVWHEETNKCSTDLITKSDLEEIAPDAVQRFRVRQQSEHEKLDWALCQKGRTLLLQSKAPSRSDIKRRVAIQHRRPMFATEEAAAVERQRVPKLIGRRSIIVGPPVDTTQMIAVPSTFVAPVFAQNSLEQHARFSLCLCRDPPSQAELDTAVIIKARKARLQVSIGQIDSAGRKVSRLCQEILPQVESSPHDAAIQLTCLSTSSSSSPSKNALVALHSSQTSTPCPRIVNDLGVLLIETILTWPGARHIFDASLDAAGTSKLLPDPARDMVAVIVLRFERDNTLVSQAAIINGSIHLLNRNAIAHTKAIAPQLMGGAVWSDEPCSLIEVANENAMLDTFIDKVLALDPDILCGYEIQQNSLGYLNDRSVALGRARSLLIAISRVPSTRPCSRTNTYGEQHSTDLLVPGRIVLNLWRLLRSELKLTSYTLQSTVMHVLGERIAFYSAESIGGMLTTIRGVCHLVRHTLRCVHLCLRMLQETSLMTRTCELARVYGISFIDVFARGSQYRVESVMIRHGMHHGYVFYSPSRENVRQQPAMQAIPQVMEPRSNFYSAPVIVLDFQSLYPSLIIAYNYCYSTCLGSIGAIQQSIASGSVPLGAAGNVRMDAERLRELLKQSDSLQVSPNGVVFLCEKIKRGLLPQLLEELLNTRIAIKKEMKSVDPTSERWARLNDRQFAIKMLSNVTYGYTAAGFSGRMPCAELADAIVQTGRETLERAADIVQSTWPDLQVVYGDTDSIFVLCKGLSRQNAFKRGAEIAERVTQMNPAPVRLQFEKVYQPSMLVAKKRYVGLKFENEASEPTIDCKGLEMVRRDGCNLLVKSMERVIELMFCKDLSVLRKYLESIWRDVEQERFPLSDFVFSPEVKLGTYRQAPPGARLSEARLRRDHRAAPLYAQRVPYVVAARGLDARLRDRVLSPSDFMHQNANHIDATYYNVKIVLRSIERLTVLVDINIESWYAERYHHKPHLDLSVRLALAQQSFTVARPTLQQQCAARHCLKCGDKLVYSSSRTHQIMRRSFCNECLREPRELMAALIDDMRRHERSLLALHRACITCSGSRHVVDKCESYACPIYWQRVVMDRSVRRDHQIELDINDW